MSEVISAIIEGLTFGSVYALLAVGLVLTYRTTGVFNLAYGPQAFLAAAVYYDTYKTHGWPLLPSLVLAVLIVSPLVGLILERFLFRYLRGAPEIAKLVSVLGLFVALPQMIILWFGANPKSNAIGILPPSDTVYHPLSGVSLDRDDIAIVIVGLLAFVGLTLLLKYTPLGLRMRAVVESPRLTELAGVDADRASMASWILSSILAGIAGVLLAPIFAGQISFASYTTLVIAAIAASVLGSLTSIPLAYAGGLALGVVQQILDRYLPTDSILASGLRPALPFVALFLVLIFSPALRSRRGISDPLSGVDPPPAVPASAERSAFMTNATHIFAVVFFAVVGYWLFFHASEVWIDRAARIAIYGVIFLSITVITGLAGQVSLCQATFAAIGACATAQLATNVGMSVFVAMLLAALFTAAIGALLALPALRLGGIFLSLATLAFAYFFSNVLLKLGWIGGGVVPVEAPRPLLGSIDFGVGDKAFLVFALAVLVVVSILVIWVRGGTTGRVLDAMRGSEVAASSIGISLTKARIVAFALSAGIAGLGGGLFASFDKAANVDSHFAPELGLVWIVLVVTLGSRTVEGAINAAVGFVFIQEVVLPTWIPWLNNHVQPWYHMDHMPPALYAILFGLGALTYARHPEGILEFNKRKSSARIERLFARFGKSNPPSTPEVAPAASGAS